MDYTELVKSLRICVNGATCVGCIKNTDGTKYGCKEFGDIELVNEAADAIEELGRMLCNWCGVCPEEKRDLWNCEIAFPNAQVPEVWIEPPKEETE